MHRTRGARQRSWSESAIEDAVDRDSARNVLPSTCVYLIPSTRAGFITPRVEAVNALDISTTSPERSGVNF
jgi:hypothetical protein